MVNFTKDFSKSYKRPNSILNFAYRNQLFACAIVNIITFSHGISFGWAAPTIRKILSNDTPLSFPVTLDEASWMASLIPLGSVISNLMVSQLIDVVGRKLCLFVLVIPHGIMWIFIYFSPNIEVLCAARFIEGLTSGGIFSTLPLFICEIADVSKRGGFQAFFAIVLNFGMFIGYIISSKVDYFLIPLIVMILPILYFFLLFYFPETPNYLLRKNKDEVALASWKFYKNFKENTPQMEISFQELKTTINNSKTENETIIGDFFNKSALKTYITCFVLLLLYQFSGVRVFTNYMSTIFETSGSPMEPDTCTIITGIVQLMGNISTLFFIDSFGRKLLLIISTAGTIFGLICFGLYMHFKDQLDTEKFSWIPLVCMIFIIYIGNIGIISTINIALVVVLPVKIRSTLFPCLMAMLSFLLFCGFKIFPFSIVVFGISKTMWVCATVTTFCLIYIIIFLPETKNKSMEDD